MLLQVESMVPSRAPDDSMVRASSSWPVLKTWGSRPERCLMCRLAHFALRDKVWHPAAGCYLEARGESGYMWERCEQEWG